MYEERALSVQLRWQCNYFDRSNDEFEWLNIFFIHALPLSREFWTSAYFVIQPLLPLSKLSAPLLMMLVRITSRYRGLWSVLLIDSPSILVPIGSPVLLMRAQALSSNRTTLPSFLWYFFAVRTTTACLISPLLTLVAPTAALAGPVSAPTRALFTTTMM